MRKLFNAHVDATLEFKRRKCEDLVPVPELNAVQSLCKLLEVLATPENGVQFTGDADMFANICRIWFFFWYKLKGNISHVGAFRFSFTEPFDPSLV